MTEYEKLALAEKFIEIIKANDKQLSSAIQAADFYAAIPASDIVGDVAIIEPTTGLTGVAITVKDMVRVYYGADDGSDDMTISADQFNQQFRVTGFVSYWE